MKKTFILGVGSQRCGTTFLKNLLDTSSYCSKPILKEHHVFDHVLEKIKKKRKEFFFEKEKIKKSLFKFKTSSFQKKKIKLLLHDLPYSYFDYVEVLLKKNLFSYDITPAYSSLSIDLLKFIKKNINNRGINLKIVFLMREPVNRLISMCQMFLMHNNKDPLLKSNLITMINKFTNQPKFINYERNRSNYRKIYSKLRDVFDQNELFFGFYENFYKLKLHKDFEKFLGLNLNHKKIKKVDFKETKKIKFLPSEIETLKEYYKDNYVFVKKKFPNIYPLWEKDLKQLVI